QCWVAAGHSRDRNDIDRDFSVARAASVTREKAERSGHSTDGVQVIHLACRRRVTYRAFIRVQDSQGVINIRNLCVDWCVKDPIPAANHRLVIFKRIPSEGDSGAKVLLVGIQRSELRVKFIAQTVVQSETRSDLPRILPVSRRERPCVVGIGGIAKSLLENLREAKGCRLQRINGREQRRNKVSGERAKDEAAREEGMRFRMIAAQ